MANLNAISQWPIGKTPHAAAVRAMEQGWRWNGRKYANREAWHAAMHESFFKKYASNC